jgi:hypothetical protein
MEPFIDRRDMNIEASIIDDTAHGERSAGCCDDVTNRPWRFHGLKILDLFSGCKP